MQFADGAAALTASDRIALRAIRDIAFVDLDKAFEKRPIWIDHSATQRLQHQPSGLVRNRGQASACSCKAEMPLEWLATA